MVHKVIKIRLIQLCREVMSIGVLRILFLLGLTAIVGFYTYVQAAELFSSLLVAGVCIIAITAIQIKRCDKLFIRTNFDHYRFLFFVEYLFFSLPVLVVFLIHGQWIAPLVLLIAIGIVVNVNIRSYRNNLNTWLQQWVPSRCIEWKAGLRKRILIVIPLWVVGMGLSFHIATVPIIMILLGVIAFSYYESCEPYQMVIAYQRGVASFLLRKIKDAVLLYSVQVLPLMATFNLFHFHLWYIPAAVYLLFVFLYVYVVLAKYAFYEPNTKSQAAKVFSSLGLLGLFFPLFIPLVWVMSIHFYTKARRNLKPYLNDFDK